MESFLVYLGFDSHSFCFSSTEMFSFHLGYDFHRFYCGPLFLVSTCSTLYQLFYLIVTELYKNGDEDSWTPPSNLDKDTSSDDSQFNPSKGKFNRKYEPINNNEITIELASLPHD